MRFWALKKEREKKRKRKTKLDGIVVAGERGTQHRELAHIFSILAFTSIPNS